MSSGHHHHHHHHGHECSEHQREEYPPAPNVPRGQLVKIFSKLNKTYNLGIRNDIPMMVPSDAEDQTQLWFKDDSHGERTKDNYGFPAFTLINAATRKLLKHPKEKGHPISLVDYQPNTLDEDLLWTESQDFGEGFKTVRMASDTSLNMTLLKEEKKSFFHRDDKSAHEIKEGTPIVLDTWHEKDNQLWKIFIL